MASADLDFGQYSSSYLFRREFSLTYFSFRILSPFYRQFFAFIKKNRQILEE